MEEGVSINILNIAFLLLLIALVIAFVRLIKGPSVNDRIAAMDIIASIIMGFILVYSIFINNAMYFDVTIAISLISFIGAVAISTYLKQKYE
jgi:multicomponent Na+:H+ antiporter subunit F